MKIILFILALTLGACSDQKEISGIKTNDSVIKKTAVIKENTTTKLVTTLGDTLGNYGTSSSESSVVPNNNMNPKISTSDSPAMPGSYDISSNTSTNTNIKSNSNNLKKNSLGDSNSTVNPYSK